MKDIKIDNSKFEVFDDPMFRFDEEAHEYTYICDKTGDVLQTFQSVTGFKSQFKEPFNSREVAENLSKSNPLYGQPVDDILKQWKQKGTDAADLGTRVHEWIESFYKENEVSYSLSDEDFMSRINKFKAFYEARLYKLKPVFQEKRIFSRKWGLAGTVDGFFETESYDLMIGDWKTNREFTTDEDYRGRSKKLLYPFEDTWDNKHNEFSIQLSLYRLIVEEETGIDLGESFLLWIPPGKHECKIFKVIDFRNRLRSFLNEKYLTM